MTDWWWDDPKPRGVSLKKPPRIDPEWERTYREGIAELNRAFDRAGRFHAAVAILSCVALVAAVVLAQWLVGWQ